MNEHGKKLLGKKIRVSLGNYPTVSLQAARARATTLLEEAKAGINPKHALRAAATSTSATVQELSVDFMKNHVHSRMLDSAHLYQSAFDVHISPRIGGVLAELLTRAAVRVVMDQARIKRKKKSEGSPGKMVGGVEAARTAMSVLRHMYSWAITESKLNRRDNPVSNVTRNLPKKVRREVVLSRAECRVVWTAARETGYPFGAHVQLMLLTGCRLSEWASARLGWVDFQEALMVIPREAYKSDHVHVVPLVPRAIDILRGLPRRNAGDYLLSTDGGATPICGISKYFKTRLKTAIEANGGTPLGKQFTSQDLRRSVATRLAEIVGADGEKLIPRVLGHADGSVTAIYNRYGYVREMRAALEQWASELTAADVRGAGSAADQCSTHSDD